jgi:hypothetical protein
MADPTTAAGTGQARAKREEVHFYPGDRLLVYLVDGKLKLHAGARGGPAHKKPRARAESMAAEPTDAGEFVIDGFDTYSTDSWPWSKIPWGTPIRPSRTHAGKIEYKSSSGTWRPLTIWITEEVPGPHETTRTVRVLVDAEMVRNRYEDLYKKRGEFPEKWVFNDFGPVAVRYFRDKNKNRKRDANEHLEGKMFHTTPDNEAESYLADQNPNRVIPINLGESHGCIHIRPADLREFREKGAFRQGMPLIVHRYDEIFDWTPYRNY